MGQIILHELKDHEAGQRIINRISKFVREVDLALAAEIDPFPNRPRKKRPKLMTLPLAEYADRFPNLVPSPEPNPSE
jgi:hypothetical protein